jgi:hypothetical protein
VYPDADIAGLVAQINSGSTLITATLVVDGVPLAHSSPAAVDGGGVDLPAAGGLPVSPLHIDAAVGAVTSTVARATEALSVRVAGGGDITGGQATADREPSTPEPGPAASEPVAGVAPEPVPLDTGTAVTAEPAPTSAEEQAAQGNSAPAPPATGAGGGATQDAVPAEAAPTPTAETTASAAATATPPGAPAAPPQG